MSGPARFAYHRAVAPMMWVLVALASIELLVVHALLSLLWSRVGALVVSAVTLAGVVWLAGAIRSMKRLPVLLDDERLVMRVGTLRTVEVPLAGVAGVRREWDAAALAERGVLRLSLIAYPNVLVDLNEPVGRRGRIRAIAHRLDDPAAFVAALERLGARG